ncbi:hypothetical protein YC2023_010898 [Brassica napus]
MRSFINRRLYGLSSRNPETGWTFVLEPGGWMCFRPGTRRLVGLSSWNPVIRPRFGQGSLSGILDMNSPKMGELATHKVAERPYDTTGFDCGLECYIKTNKERYVYLQNHSTRNKTVLSEEQRDKLINLRGKSID